MNNQQRGIMTMEVLGALAIGSLMLAGLSAMVDSALEDTKAEQAAHYHSQVVSAANKYIKANYSTLAVAANTTATAKATVADLVAANLLPPGFGTVNPYGQTPCVLIRATSKVIGGQTVYFANALVVTEGTAQQAIPEKNLLVAAAQSGMSGGAISSRAPTEASGTYDAWRLNATTSPTLAQFLSTNCSGNTAGAGSLASALFYDGPGQLSTDFIYRNAVPGRPELNQMNTPLRLAGNATVTENSACGSAAAIAVDASRNLMSCDSSGLWKRVTTWKHPVTNYAALPATDSTGDVRMTLDSGRAFMHAGGGNWEALAVDQNGDLSVPRHIDAWTGHIWARNSHVTAGQDLVSGRDTLVGRNLDVEQDAYIERDLRTDRDIFSHRNVNVAGEVNTRSLFATRSIYAGIDVNAGSRLQGDTVYTKRNIHTQGYVIASGNMAIGGTLSENRNLTELNTTYGEYQRFPTYIRNDGLPPNYVAEHEAKIEH